jgi:hypothetical protein
MTRFVPDCATATNKPFAYVTERQALVALVPVKVLEVQVIPSGEVITRFVPLHATATNKPFP